MRPTRYRAVSHDWAFRPYTAVAVVHRLSASLSHLMGRALPPGVFRDESGVVWVVCPRPSYASLTEAAFDQIRQNGAGKPLVVIHLLEALARIAEHVRLPAQAAVLAKQLRTIEQDAEREIASPSDRADVKKCGLRKRARRSKARPKGTAARQLKANKAECRTVSIRPSTKR